MQGFGLGESRALPEWAIIMLRVKGFGGHENDGQTQQ